MTHNSKVLYSTTPQPFLQSSTVNHKGESPLPVHFPSGREREEMFSLPSCKGFFCVCRNHFWLPQPERSLMEASPGSWEAFLPWPDKWIHVGTYQNKICTHGKCSYLFHFRTSWGMALEFLCFLRMAPFV